MRALRLVHSDEQSDIFEWEEPAFIELHDEDVCCDEPAAEARPSVRMRYASVNAFLGQYLARMRRGEPVVIAAPREVASGALIDVEIAIDQLERFVLHAQVLGRWPLDGSELAEVQFVAGRLTDRIVAPIAERALGARHAAKILKS